MSAIIPCAGCDREVSPAHIEFDTEGRAWHPRCYRRRARRLRKQVEARRRSSSTAAERERAYINWGSVRYRLGGGRR